MTVRPSHSRNHLAAGFAVLFSLTAVTAASGRAQEIRTGGMPVGVQMTVIHRPYQIVAATGQEVLDQLRVNGWTRYRLTYRYRHANERIPLFNGTPSQSCRPFDFEILYEVEVSYPQWTPSPDASPELVGAWDAFARDVESQWETYRDDIVGRGRDAARRLRRFEEVCAFLNQRVREEVMAQFDGDEPITRREPLQRVRWPPDGHAAIMAAGTGRESPGADSGSSAESAALEEPAPEPVRPAVTLAPTIDLAVALDLDDGASGLVVDLYHEGVPQFREAFGTDGPAGTAPPMTPEAAFDFSGFTEVLIAAEVHLLAARGALELDAPLATVLVDLPSRLGTVTFRQLLDHRAALDNAMPPESNAWSATLDALDDRALFTEPDAVYSYSRYSYPLAARAVEAVTGGTFESAVERDLMGPLGLTSTRFSERDAPAARDGLPVVRTTAEDLRRFWDAWLDAEIPGSGPDVLARVPPDPTAVDGRTFTSGFWYDRIEDRPRISLMCGSSRTGYAAGFHVYPDTRTILSFWARYDLGRPDGPRPPPSANRWPKASVRFVLSRIAGALGLTEEVYRPTMIGGGAQAGSSPARCPQPAVSERRIADFGPRAQPGDWPGRYVNGEWFYALEQREGRLVTVVDPTSPPHTIRHWRGTVYFTDIDLPDRPSVGFPLRLIRDHAGRRYVVLGDRAFLHEEDRPWR